MRTLTQQAFSLEHSSTLHLAIPALETLHKAWSSCAARPKYVRFSTALKTAVAELDKYYEKLSCIYISHAFIFYSLVRSLPLTFANVLLDPTAKMAHFKKHWSEDLHGDVLSCADEVVS
jgi:hypothetical protein